MIKAAFCSNRQEIAFGGVRGQAYGIALKQRFHRTLIVDALGNVDLILRAGDDSGSEVKF